MVERSLRQAGADCTEQAVEVLVVTRTYNTTAIFVPSALSDNVHVPFFPSVYLPQMT